MDRDRSQVRTVTRVLITVDTELSARFQKLGRSARDNYDSSILGRTARGDFGIGWQMDVLDCHGLKGVYFIDPMPALVLGEQVVADIVGLVLARGHEVQLHCHTEWLEWAKDSPVEGRRGRNIGDFSRGDQQALLEYGADVLERAGVSRPTAFRAGNFGANDDTLAALSALGLTWDSSVNADYVDGECGVTFDAARNFPMELGQVVEVPVSGLFDRPGHFRPAQVCALSWAEMRAALAHAGAHGHPAFTIVTHSFEMLSRDRSRPNGTVIARFEALANFLGKHRQLATAGFNDLDPAIARCTDGPRLGPSAWRTQSRKLAQAWATLRYERALRPA